MIDIPSHCRAREKQLSEVGLHIADVLRAASVNRASWTRWKNGSISPQLSTLQRTEDAIEKALAKAAKRQRTLSSLSTSKGEQDVSGDPTIAKGMVSEAKRNGNGR